MGLKKGIPSFSVVLEPGVVIHRAQDGGPTRFGVTGLKRNTTHFHTPDKAGKMLLPVDSNPEFAAMLILDISTSVVSYMAQPHLLEFKLAGKKREYTPDLEVVVPLWFAHQLQKGVPFAKAAFKMPPNRTADEPFVVLVLEIKKDLSKEGYDYREKIAEAERIYYRHNYYYFVLEDCDIYNIDCSHLPSILADRSISPPEHAYKKAIQHLKSAGNFSTYAAMMDVFGGGPDGREITNYLHINGLIWVDMSINPLKREEVTAVALPPLLGPKRQAALLNATRAA